MKKSLPIIVIAIVAIALVALFYFKKPTSQISTPSATQEMPPLTTQQPTKMLSFDSNDNLNQAFDDLKTLDSAGMQ